MEQLTKKQVVESMYALRAGLSAISVESDRIKQTYDKYEKDVDGEIRKYNNEFSIPAEDLFDGSAKRNAKSSIRNNVFGLFLRIGITLILLALLIFAVITVINCIKFLMTCEWVGDITDAEMGQMLAGIGIAVLAAAVAVASLIFFIKALKRMDLTFTISYIRKEKIFIKKIPYLKKYTKDMQAQTSQKLMPMMQACEELQKKLYELYGEWLDERDWQHIDLIIYYIETHRADSLKEALLLVEREIQTQRIISAIEQATAQICATLRQGFYAIGQAVNNLSSQLLAMQKIQSAQMANLTSAVNFNNALQAKANVTSKQLMQDVSAIRSNSDYFTARLKKAYPQ